MDKIRILKQIPRFPIITHTCCISLGWCSFGLETRVTIKISNHPCYPINVVWFSLGWSKKKKFEKKNSKWQTQKNNVFQNRQFSKNFCENFMDWTWNAFFVFLGCFCPYVGQPHNRIDWATSMPFALFAAIIPTNARTNPWN